MRNVFAVVFAVVATCAFAAEPAIAPQLKPLIGEFEGTFEQQVQKGEWSTSTIAVNGRPLVSERYVELRGTYDIAGFEKPMELVMLWSWDPFQKEYRLAVLDDLVGLLDVFEQVSSTPLKLTNLSHDTFFQDEKGRRSHTAVTVQFLEDDALRIEWAGSIDRGTTWRELGRVTLRRKGR
jgi:hypothetical protein